MLQHPSAAGSEVTVSCHPARHAASAVHKDEQEPLSHGLIAVHTTKSQTANINTTHAGYRSAAAKSVADGIKTSICLAQLLPKQSKFHEAGSTCL